MQEEETLYYIIHLIHGSLLTCPNTFVLCCSGRFLTGYEPCLVLPVAAAALYLSHLQAAPPIEQELLP